MEILLVLAKTSDNLIGREPMPNSANPKKHIFVASMDIEQDAKNYMQKINKITKPFPEILTIYYFRELRTCRTIPK